MKPMLAMVLLALLSACNILNDYGNAACGQNPAWCAAGQQTQTCPVLLNVTGTVTVWECNIPPQYCNGAQGLPGEGAGGGSVVAAGCGCVICQTSEQAALADAQQILAMQSLSVDPGGPPLQCRGPLATLSAAYDTGSLFTVNECMQVTQATCRPCDDGQGGTLQSVGQNCGTNYLGMPGVSNCCSGLACIDPSTGEPLSPYTGDSQGFCQGTLATCPKAAPCIGLGESCLSPLDGPLSSNELCCTGSVCVLNPSTPGHGQCRAEGPDGGLVCQDIGGACTYLGHDCCQPPSVAYPLICSEQATNDPGTCCRDINLPCATTKDCCPKNSVESAAQCQGGICCASEGGICGYGKASGACCAGLKCLPSAGGTSKIWWCSAQGG